MDRNRHCIGVDLGGTWVRVALFDENGRPVEKMVDAVNVSRKEAIAEQIIALSRRVCKRNNIECKSLRGIGIVSAGPLDVKRGMLIHPVNLPFDKVPLTAQVAEELKTPAFLVNDCTGVVLGERKFGAGKRLDNLFYVTMGTGIGGGAIVNGHLLLGKDGNAVEIGHFTIDLEGKLKCGCGRRGHWEAYCSGKNMPNFARMEMKKMDKKRIRASLLYKKLKGKFSSLTSKDLFTAAKNGDSLSRQLVKEIGVLNAIGFANIVNAYDPSLITVGGAVALENKQLVLAPIRKYVGRYALNRLPKIISTPLGEDAGIYGAAAIVLEFSSCA